MPPDSDRKNCVAFSAMRSRVSTQANAPEAATMNMMPAELTIARASTLNIDLNVSSL